MTNDTIGGQGRHLAAAGRTGNQDHQSRHRQGRRESARSGDFAPAAITSCWLFRMPEATRRRDRFRRLLHTRRSVRDDARALHGRGSPEGLTIRGGRTLSARNSRNCVSCIVPGVGEVAVIGLQPRKMGTKRSPPSLCRAWRRHRKEELSASASSLAPHKTPRHWFLRQEFFRRGPGAARQGGQDLRKLKLRELWAKGRRCRPCERRAPPHHIPPLVSNSATTFADAASHAGVSRGQSRCSTKPNEAEKRRTQTKKRRKRCNDRSSFKMILPALELEC